MGGPMSHHRWVRSMVSKSIRSPAVVHMGVEEPEPVIMEDYRKKEENMRTSASVCILSARRTCTSMSSTDTSSRGSGAPLSQALAISQKASNSQPSQSKGFRHIYWSSRREPPYAP